MSDTKEQSDQITEKLKEMFRRLSFKSDLSLWILIILNILSLVIAIVENENFGYVVLIAWGQSIIVGIFATKRISKVKEFAIEPASEDRKEFNPNHSKNRLAVIFFLSYSLFHIVYLAFILFFYITKSVELPSILSFFCLIVLFFFHHLYVYNKRNKRELNDIELPRLSKLTQEPFIRMVPVHLIMLFGVVMFSMGMPGIIGIIVFQLIKLFFDMLFHAFKNL